MSLSTGCGDCVSLFYGSMFQTLVARLCDGTGVNANNAVVTGVLSTVGELAKVVGYTAISGSCCSRFFFSKNLHII